MTNTSASLLRISSFNCNSLGDSKKRSKVLQYFKKKNYDLTVLVDTRISPSSENLIRNEWDGQIIFNSYKSNARGILILIKKNLPLEILETKKDDVGNTLQILARFDEKTISITTLYAPNTDSPGFFNSTFRIMETWDTDFQIFLGDWNLVQDQDNDTHGYLHVNNINAKNTVLDAKDNFDLVDPWRIKNTTKKFTWFKKSNNNIVKCARLDFFLISNSLSPYVVDTCILPGVFSDHSIIKIDLDFSKVQMGPGYFKFNNSLLKNLNYIEHIKKLILKTTELYSTDDLGEEYWQNIQPQHIQNINLNINAQLFFDVLLMEIRGFSVEYCSRLKKEKTTNLTP